MTPDFRKAISELRADLRNAGFDIAAMGYMPAEAKGIEYRDFTGRPLYSVPRALLEESTFSVRED